MNPVPEITPPAFTWENNGPETDEQSALLSWVRIFGIDYHAEAIEVDEEGNATNAVFQINIDSLRNINGSDEPFYTISFKGRSYVVYFYPFAD
jgi:hypothetical protein